MDLLYIVNKILALGTIGSQIFLVLAIIYIVLPFKKLGISDFFKKNGLGLAFIFSLIATCGSLFYSNYAGFMPCTLCWYQRIFMYPQVVLLGLALIKKDEKIIDYSLALSIIGWIISVYHNYIYIQGLHATICTATESCITPYVTEFGYVTIPMMAITAFSLIILFLTTTAFYKNFK